jgi:hypothetical protein
MGNNFTENNDFRDKSIWTNDIRVLLKDPIFIPTDDMTIEQQINCITRLVFGVFILFLIFMSSSINSFIFLLISLVIIIFIYNYYKRMYNKNTKENFTFKSPKYSKDSYKKPIYDTKKRVFCDNFTELNPGPDYFSRNKLLTGPPQPRTFTKPVIVDPAYDLDAWRDNNNIVFSQINKQTNEDLYFSGVEPSTCCGNLENAYRIPDEIESNIFYKNIPETPKYFNKEEIIEPISEDFTYDKIPEQIKNKYGDFMDRLSLTIPKSEVDIDTKITENYIDYPGGVNRQCGYNPTQVYKSNLPSNYPASNCEQISNVANYNKNLFTQIVQPGVYYNSDVIEPVNSNIGISFNQQIEPTTCQFTNDGGILYKAHDPSMVNVVRPNDRDNITNSISNDNIYDPRSYGYGTSYRSYTHDVTGQTRFMYDDIDAIRMPNYITRSNIDFESYADSYGPLKEENGNPNNSNIRALAQDSWLRNSLQFRNDLTLARSRKQLAREWQQKAAPIHTMNTKAIASRRAN